MTQANSPSTARIMVYSHDAFGLGNLRRMLAICEYLLDCCPHLSVLLVSGSPMIHAFRLPKGLDYIKLPCLNRDVSGQLSAKYLGTSFEETVALRSHLIQLSAIHFKPDLLLVDKKPTGLGGELGATLDYLQGNLPNSKCVLLLRDILDAPEKTVDEWVRWRYYQTIQTYYDQILVVGMQAVFDVVQEYRLPAAIAHKVRYCGYIHKRAAGQEVEQAEDGNYATPPIQPDLKSTDRLVLVTPGGGEDGYSLVNTYLAGLKSLAEHPSDLSFHSLILCGPEMPLAQQSQLQQLAAECSGVTFRSFTNHLLSYLAAADVVVAMSGYNTVTEILALRKQAVVVPRTQPSQEQLIRATRFAQRGWVTMLHPDKLKGRSLLRAVVTKLANPSCSPSGIDFNGLPQICRYLSELLSPPVSSSKRFRDSPLMSLLV